MRTEGSITFAYQAFGFIDTQPEATCIDTRRYRETRAVFASVLLQLWVMEGRTATAVMELVGHLQAERRLIE
jgi:hypothetical protein